jgi:excinuclease ABC subunit C
MATAAKARRYEEAVILRNKIFALQHIQDVAVLQREDENALSAEKRVDESIDFMGRIEGYDISNISGTSSVASMVVFERGVPRKTEYRKFRMKTVEGSNDVASMKEVLTRRLRHSGWRHPDVLLIDGGWPQVHVAQEVVRAFNLTIPIVGLAKGPERKKDELIFDAGQKELGQLAEKYLALLVQVRDEAHRFALAYHRNLRGRRMLDR